MNETANKPDKKILIILILTILILTICVISTISAFRKPESRYVLIIQNNQIIQEIRLDSAENQEFKILSADGGYNLIRIQNHEISISEADCPDQTCMKTGILRSENLPIVCLPHKLIIRFAEEGEFS
ncbi:MAG: NusG domain II-containing protein [Oscillospiraceae bacterium]|nr:NusG domain II-containing protein [Oscillospiraceae bacterium]